MGYDEDHEDRDEEDTDFNEGYRPTTKKGLLESGIQGHDNYFAGGKQSIDRLLKKGTIELR